MVEMLVQTMIQAMYPGGMAEFDRKFTTFITRDNKFIIAPLKAGNELASDLKELFVKSLNKIQVEMVVASKANFSNWADSRDAQGPFEESLKGKIKPFEGQLQITVNEALMDVIAPNITMDSVEGKKLKEAVSSAIGICNIRIEYKDETFFQLETESSSGSTSEPSSKSSSKLVTGRPDRDMVINKDDTMNLKIALGQAQSVDDFIEMM